MIQIDLSQTVTSIVVMGNFLSNLNVLLDFSNPLSGSVVPSDQVSRNFQTCQSYLDIVCRTTSVLVLDKQVNVEWFKNVRDQVVYSVLNPRFLQVKAEDFETFQIGPIYGQTQTGRLVTCPTTLAHNNERVTCVSTLGVMVYDSPVTEV